MGKEFPLFVCWLSHQYKPQRSTAQPSSLEKSGYIRTESPDYTAGTVLHGRAFANEASAEQLAAVNLLWPEGQSPEPGSDGHHGLYPGLIGPSATPVRQTARAFSAWCFHRHPKRPSKGAQLRPINIGPGPPFHGVGVGTSERDVPANPWGLETRSGVYRARGQVPRRAGISGYHPLSPVQVYIKYSASPNHLHTALQAAGAASSMIAWGEASRGRSAGPLDAGVRIARPASLQWRA